MSNFRRGLMMATPKEYGPGEDGRIWAYYVTTAANQTVTLVSGSATGMPNTMIVDDVEVTFSSSYTFAEAGTHLVKFSIGSTVPTYMFYNIPGPKVVYWPKGTTSVGAQVFRSVSGMEKVEVPGTVTRLENRAFYLASVKVIVLRPTTPPVLGSSTAFYNIQNLQKIFVPYSDDHSILNAYKTKNQYSNYAAKFYELNPDGSIPTE